LAELVAMLFTVPFDPIYIAYVALVLMAIAAILVGSFDSIPSPGKNEEREVLSSGDAYWFPVIGSVVLFSFYMLFTVFGKELINMLITAYFAIFGAISISRLTSPVLRNVVHWLLGFKPATSENVKEKAPIGWKQSMLEPYEFKVTRLGHVSIEGSIDIMDVIGFILASVFTAYYVFTKHWIASNLFGMSFAIGAISLLHLDSFATGMILLSGLFIYDIFWVFGTNVMVTVAKSFDAPIKLLWPRDIFASKYEFALLGLGDIVIPGIFVALCLRFDHERAGKPLSKYSYSKPYFWTCYFFYILGLAATIFVMHYFKAAQPALLYLSPACIISVLLTSLVRREVSKMWSFSTEPHTLPAEKTE
jgi:minor histocompatibility antigen H13